MGRSIRCYCISGWLLLLPGYISAHECNKLDFLVYKGTEKVGKLCISMCRQDKKTTYSLISDVSIDFIFGFKIVETITDVFENGCLKSSKHTRHVNEVLKADNTLERMENRYKTVNSDKIEGYIEDRIQLSVLSLYFKEPLPNQLIYSENFQQLVKLEKTGDHAFTLKLPNGTNTTYEYSGDNLQDVVSQTRYGTIKFVRQ